MSRSQMIEETLMLKAWGRWARVSLNRELGTKPQSWTKFVLLDQGAKMDLEKVAEPPPRIDDDTASGLDKMLCGYQRMNGTGFRLIYLYYVMGMDLRQVGERMHIGYQPVRDLWHQSLNEVYELLGEVARAA